MFWLLHLLAIIFFFPALFATIPLHLLFSAVGDMAKLLAPPPAVPLEQPAVQYVRNKAGHLVRVS